MSLSKKDCQRVLVLLEEYNKKLDATSDEEVKKSLSKLIEVLRSSYFGALIDIQEYYEEILKDANEHPDRVEREAQVLANKWQR